MMKSKFKLLLKIGFFIIVAVNFSTFVYATELELSTDVLKNRQENYSSLTDVNGIKLFTDDVLKKIDEETKNKFIVEQKNKEELFTEKININSENKVYSGQLFNEPTVFNKNLGSNEKNSFIVPVVIACTVIAIIIIFYITRKAYSKRRIEDSEIDFNIYE